MMNDETAGLPDDLSRIKEPFDVFDAWFAAARASEINDPNAMALATVDAAGLPNVRMVLLNGIDAAGAPDRGFMFFTNCESAKGTEITTHPKAALLFHWKSLRRQVRLRGPLAPVTPAEADRYFATRARESRIGAWASAQSRPLSSRAKFLDEVREAEARFEGQDVIRPPHWSGFRLTPVEVEFWNERPYRLHDRVVFRRRNLVDAWSTTRLYP